VDGRRKGPSGASIWAAQTIDPKRKLVYAVTGDSFSEPSSPSSDAVIAFDLETGAKRWESQSRARDNFVVGCDGARRASIVRHPIWWAPISIYRLRRCW
jgi:polyvinyl alcohol dehydrogenase (cytochrome)